MHLRGTAVTVAGCGRQTRMHPPQGSTLMETIIALAVAAIVVALIGALFAASITAWRRGGEQREAQAQASILVEVMARDIRGASQAPGVVIRPTVPAAEGDPLLAVVPSGSGRADREAVWILYVHRPERREVHRQIAVPDPSGHLVPREGRIVATDVEQITLTQASGGITIEVHTRRGRETARSRTTAAPRNP